MAAAPALRLTREAQDELDRYLRRVKAALRTHPSVDADDIERDIRGHIEAELAEAPGPITEAHLRGVLERLGTPSQWIPADDRPAWHHVLVRLRSGPEDWRLAYLTCALFIVSAVTGAFAVTSLIVGAIGAASFVASILLARATLALLDEEDEALGARRWLVYPPLLVIYVAVALALLFGLPGVIASAGDPSLRMEARQWFAEPFWLNVSLWVAFGAGAWWTVLGLCVARFTRAVKLLFWPFAEWCERRHGLQIAGVGISVATVAAATLGIVAWTW